jgi:hypothetical protein
LDNLLPSNNEAGGKFPNLLPFENRKIRYAYFIKYMDFFLSHFQNPASSSHIMIIITQYQKPGDKHITTHIIPPFYAISPS